MSRRGREAHYSDAELAAEIRRLGDELERVPSTSDWLEHRARPALSTIRLRLGSWPEALRAAGYDANAGWTRERILDAMLDWSRDHGHRAPVGADWKTADPDGRWPCEDTVRRLFGTWTAAVGAAGFAPPPTWTRGRIIDAMAEWARTHGRPPRTTDWQKTDPDGRHPTMMTVFSRFGSWSQAIAAAGLGDDPASTRTRTPAAA